MNEQTIKSFLDAHNYDIRITNNGRWMDQKCTMDVVCIVADCIVEFISDDREKEFTVKDIWYNDYTVQNVQQVFSKPAPDKKSPHEYDKYFGQPMRVFDSAGILERRRAGRGYLYRVKEYDLLEYISFRERNCYNFLCMYIEKALKDSGMYHVFEEFFTMQDKNSYKKLKDFYADFTIKNTPINGTTECGRIFTKVLNPLACKYKKCGTEWGRISKDIITQDKLMYNRRNWRDINSKKPKSSSRQEYEQEAEQYRGPFMDKYRITRAKRNLRRFNDRYYGGKTELLEARHISDRATQMHHIFPASEYPTIADYLENLIALTPTQHYSYAHPDNNTQYIDREYQHQCLIAKVNSVRRNLLENEDEPDIYEFRSLQNILNTGLATEEFNEVDYLDFNGLLSRVEKYY